MRQALFLDRDGVINIDTGYVHTREAFLFVPGIFELCLAAIQLDYVIVVVTNQAGIGRGYYTEDDFHRLTDWMVAQFADRHIQIADVYYSPHHPEFGIGSYRAETQDRKPAPGMLLKAAAKHGLSLPNSALIGDKGTDVLAARAAGIGTRILFGRDPSFDLVGGEYVIDSLADAAPLLVRLRS